MGFMAQHFDTLVWVAAGLVTLATLLRLVVYPVYRELREVSQWWRKFMRDWDGEESQPGRARTPGVMERLNKIDGQLHRNGGESLKDKVCEMHDIASRLWDKVEVIEQRQVEIQTEQRHIAGRLSAVERDSNGG